MQLGLFEGKKSKRGGRRRKAGRKKSGRVSHAARVHNRTNPVHVTLKVLEGLPTLRGHKLGRLIGRYFRLVLGRRDAFRVTHFSIQSNHLHIIVEAEDQLALSRGMQGFKSGLARLINARLGRSGTLWRDRYHARDLDNPTAVRHALVYVLQNHAHHGGRPGVDPWSSATWFTGWQEVAPATADSPVAAPRTWLLRVGWRQVGGPISIHEVPR